MQDEGVRACFACFVLYDNRSKIRKSLSYVNPKRKMFVS